jgi:hypothetical protein
MEGERVGCVVASFNRDTKSTVGGDLRWSACARTVLGRLGRTGHSPARPPLPPDTPLRRRLPPSLKVTLLADDGSSPPGPPPGPPPGVCGVPGVKGSSSWSRVLPKSLAMDRQPATASARGRSRAPRDGCRRREQRVRGDVSFDFIKGVKGSMRNPAPKTRASRAKGHAHPWTLFEREGGPSTALPGQRNRRCGRTRFHTRARSQEQGGTTPKRRWSRRHHR